ncbi:MAG TPA: hypothetical protein VE818_03915 [Nitrososphaeraceae archaeon]|nr:hypothetical protein [Nitrososphaeraceae archaeon]
MLHNKVKQKKEQVHKTKNIAQNDKLAIEIDTLHWVIAQSLSIRRLLKGEESELSYDTTTAITIRLREE